VRREETSPGVGIRTEIYKESKEEKTLELKPIK